jgi:ribosomal protein S27AE
MAKHDFNDIIGYLSYYFGVIYLAIALVTLLYILPDVLSHFHKVLSISTSQYAFGNVVKEPVITISVIALLFIFIVISTGSMFSPVSGKYPSFGRSGNKVFFRLFSIAILVQLIISLFSVDLPGAAASDLFLKKPLYYQWFVMGGSVLFQSVFFQLIPICVMIAVILVARKSLTWPNFINMKIGSYGTKAAVVIAATVIPSVIFSGSVYEFVSALLTFFILNIIYLKSGFFRAFLVNFIISFISIFSELLSSTPVFDDIFTAFLLVTAFIGVMSISELIPAPKLIQNTDPEQAREDRAREYAMRNRVPGNMLWIRSACPSCGNVTFHVKENGDLECTKCHEILDRNAVGDFNVHVVMKGPYSH